MSRKILGVFLLIGGLCTASVFGGQIAVLAEKIPAMFVSNDEAHAVPVRDLDDPGRRAFAFFKNDTYRDGEESHFARFTVPEGKRLVLQSLSVQAALGSGQTMILASVQGKVNDKFYVHHLAPTFTGPTESGGPMFVCSEERTLYADGGTEVALAWLRNDDTGGGITNAFATGYLIDCETGACK